MGALEALVLTLAVSAGNDTALVDFYSDNCPPCRQMMPLVRQLADQGFPVRAVNIDREPALAARFRVSAVPCFVMLVDGREVDRAVGLQSVDRLKRMCAIGQPGRGPNPPVAVQLVNNEASKSPAVIVPAVRSGPAFSASAPRGTVSSAPRDGSAPVPGWRLTSPDWASPATPADRGLEERLLSATVRLRIEDPRGYSCGSGTIVDAREGQALILTCGHLFREAGADARIEVDIFGPTPMERIPARLKHYRAPKTNGFDPTADLALVVISAPGPLAVARIAPSGYRPAKGATVTSVGCDSGKPPTVCACHVTAIDKFAGAPNVETSEVPVQGRSGGGLFSSEGYLIGVCNAANPSDNEGIYAALDSIHFDLDQQGMSWVYRGGSAGEPALAAAPPDMPRQMPPPSEVVQWTGAATRPEMSHTTTGPIRADEKATIDELRRRRDEGAEVICIVRAQ